MVYNFNMINAYATKKAKTKIEPFSYEENIGPSDVLIQISYCGICHSDVHLIDGDWGEVYPLVPGHEILGTIIEIGDMVTELKNGDTVGTGWQCSSCHKCKQCNQSNEHFCKENIATCMDHHGGFADKVVVNEGFAIKIPNEMNKPSTAPLLCGGITVYSPLKKYAEKNSHVAIVGIGGLGHIALQIAKAMGCKVTALSRSPEKEKESREFGANNFLLEPEINTYDLILNTAHVTLPMEKYIAALQPEGVFVQLGISPEPVTMNWSELIMNNKVITGSSTGSPDEIKEFLEFAHKNNIAAKIELMSMNTVNEAVEKVRSNKARYRVVLENDLTENS